MAATSTNEAASQKSAVLTPSAATTSPPRAGPAAPAAVKPTLMIALPWRSWPAGLRTAAADARVKARAAIASVPSTIASATTSTSEKLSAVRASAMNVSASPRYRSGSTSLVPAGSVRATTPWLRKAGRKCIPMNKAAVASGLPVWSKTSTASAISPTQLPSSLTVYAPASWLNPGSRSGASARFISLAQRRATLSASCVECRRCITGCTTLSGP